jgi:hypothetical protein
MEMDRVIAALRKLADLGAVDKVLTLREVRNNPELAAVDTYRRAFNNYYRLRQKPSEFYRDYFSMLQNAAAAPVPPSLEAILQYLYDNTGERHLSFGSKMLATITDDAVVFDKNVAGHFGVGTTYKKNWLPDALQRYQQVRRGIETFIQAPDWPHMRALFDQAFPNAVHLADIRKADLIIWAAYEP